MPARSESPRSYAYAKRHVRNPSYTFGTGKVGDLAGFASALVLGLIAVGIGAESMMRFFRPVSVAFDEATVIAVVGLAVNVVSVLLLGGVNHRHDHHGHDHGNEAARGHAGDNNMRSAYIHVLADAFTSVLAIAALLAGRYLGLFWMDPVMGIVGAVVIARWSWTLMRDTASVLLDRTDLHVAAEVRQLVESSGDTRIADLHVWRVGPEAHAAIVSVVAQPGITSDTIRARLAPVHELAHLTVECH